MPRHYVAPLDAITIFNLGRRRALPPLPPETKPSQSATAPALSKVARTSIRTRVFTHVKSISCDVWHQAPPALPYIWDRQDVGC